MHALVPLGTGPALGEGQGQVACMHHVWILMAGGYVCVPAGLCSFFSLSLSSKKATVDSCICLDPAMRIHFGTHSSICHMRTCERERGGAEKARARECVCVSECVCVREEVVVHIDSSASQTPLESRNEKKK